jgi:hypothetical protein
MSDKKDELDALQRRVAELERAATPEPYITDWVVPPPAIDRVSMSPSAMREMAQAVPTSLIRDVVGDNRAPQGPSSQGVVPTSQQVSNVRSGGSPRGGWAREIPLSNPPGINWVDALCEVDAAKERGVRMVEEAKLKATEPK